MEKCSLRKSTNRVTRAEMPWRVGTSATTSAPSKSHVRQDALQLGRGGTKGATSHSDRSVMPSPASAQLRTTSPSLLVNGGADAHRIRPPACRRRPAAAAIAPQGHVLVVLAHAQAGVLPGARAGARGRRGGEDRPGSRRPSVRCGPGDATPTMNRARRRCESSHRPSCFPSRALSDRSSVTRTAG